jgi:hypothetical protein
VLRYGEERDRDYLAVIFTEVWAGIPEKDRAAILSRGYGQIAVDVLRKDRRDFKTRFDTSGDIRLKRSAVDMKPRKALVHLVAREFAHKVDDIDYPDFVARRSEPPTNAKRRVVAILERWGYPAKETREYTPADKERMRANLATATDEASQDDSQESEP